MLVLYRFYGQDLIQDSIGYHRFCIALYGLYIGFIQFYAGFTQVFGQVLHRLL